MMYTDDGRFEVLAAEREKRGLTQKNICDMTRIPLQHLEALERGDFNKVPGGRTLMRTIVIIVAHWD